MVSGPASESLKSDLARVDQLPYRARDLLYRHVGVGTVLVEDVDVVGPKVAQAVLGDLADALRPTVHKLVGGPKLCQVHPELGGIEPELGGDHHLVPKARDRPAEKLLVRTRPHPVELGSVEHRHAELVGAPDRGDAPLLVGGGTVGQRHAHRPEPDGPNLETLLTQLPALHPYLLNRPPIRPTNQLVCIAYTLVPALSTN
jgi:hypothetical protein